MNKPAADIIERADEYIAYKLPNKIGPDTALELIQDMRDHISSMGEQWYLIGVKDNSSFPQYWCKKDDKGYWKINSFPKVYMHDVYPDMEIYQQAPGV